MRFKKKDSDTFDWRSACIKYVSHYRKVVIGWRTQQKQQQKTILKKQKHLKGHVSCDP